MQTVVHMQTPAPQVSVNDSFHHAFGADRKDTRKLRRQRKGWKV